MEVIRISPRGYCYGVVDALKIARQAAKDPTLPRPIYIIGQIIHNRHAINELSEMGIVTLDGPDRATILEQVTAGTVIFTAHGVSPQVKQRASERGLHCIDATCPDVTVTHDLVRDLVAKGYYILYIGKKGHPEPEGVMGEIPGHVSLVETEADVDSLQLTPAQEAKLAVSTQTTLSKWDTQRVIRYIKDCYPQAEVHIDICAATQSRQEAVAEQAKGADLTIVVGDPRSNNTNRLVQVSQELAGVPAVRIEDLSQLKPEWLKGKWRVAVTAGASTPSQLTRAVIRYLEQYEPEPTAEAAAPSQ
ncbi:4-hydroxy-3-methylbut-2-enyl diphosphate reductase [Ktedonosporobacter rubrisoli]|uniref:4-hydroxy-3-methylbut-2-enyl diphosphate reductase n=1 Tax=Ktedonosporobacter rubrisoli TaxID=2509675 RepID=A0A4P6JYM8_KTERU|nr:4-hydroxy-3-methylbut-2-enyl diphosphate reductase [Ktedonosporobacter rubrisoli]QBD80909.1 4-hydroxy-3-methylbut-2-enyl diphosphate reductase [Ktedonosporobacter rubrisoli]